MKCPKCEQAMEVVEFGTEISLERCSGCHGLYCEREILARMRDEWLTETVLDTGCAAEGARHNDMRDIICPSCGATMEHFQDEEQSHITLDTCLSCDKIFLDAGELTDMKEVTLMDHVRRLLSMLGR